MFNKKISNHDGKNSQINKKKKSRKTKTLKGNSENRSS